MSQTINFLKALPKSSQRLSALLMGLIVLSAFILLFLISTMVGIKQHNTKLTLNRANTDLSQVQHTYDQLAKTYPLLVSDTPLVNQVKALEQQVQARQEEYDSLEHLTVRRGFAEYMLALAQTVPASLWFNHIQINQDKGSVTLDGYAVRPDDVSVLMSRLMKTPAYAKVIFDLFFVKAIKNHSYVKFSIATDTLGSEDEKEEPTTSAPKE